MFLKILSALTVICCCGFPIHAGMSACAAEVARVNSNVDPGFILSHIDSLYRSKASSSEMEMTIKTPHWQRKLVLTVWTSGMDRTFIKISYPKKEKGIATLRIGNEMWNYLPRVGKVIKIPPSMMMGSWMGSDFTNDDLVNEFSYKNDYVYEFQRPENPHEELYYIKCVPKEDLPIVWGRIEMAVRKKDLIPVWEKYFDERGRLIRTLNFKDVRMFGGRRIPAVMELVPVSSEGHLTVLEYISARFDLELNERIFSLRNLRTR